MHVVIGFSVIYHPYVCFLTRGIRPRLGWKGVEGVGAPARRASRPECLLRSAAVPRSIVAGRSRASSVRSVPPRKICLCVSPERSGHSSRLTETRRSAEVLTRGPLLARPRRVGVAAVRPRRPPRARLKVTAPRAAEGGSRAPLVCM